MKADHIVFLAEDDTDDQEMLIEMMVDECKTLDFLVANTGSRALEMLNDLPEDKLPCLIILDYNLPEISGAELLERLKAFRKFDTVMKVVWSTSNSPIYQKKCLDLGAHLYIIKPTDFSGIRTVARELVELCIKK